jgi:thiol-disulfide isomerase/thioredoxin
VTTTDFQAGVPRVFISYRRDDSPYLVRRLYDDLSARFGRENVLMDVESVIPGTGYVDLRSTLAFCDVVLVVIGPLGLTSHGPIDLPTLDDPQNMLRTEIEQSLVSGRIVIPVLVGGAILPRAADLPESMAGLMDYQAFELNDLTWPDDVARLTFSIGASFGARGGAVLSAPRVSPPAVAAQTPKSRNPKHIFLMVGPIVLVVLVVVVLVVVSAIHKSPSRKLTPPIAHSEQSSLLTKVTSVPESVFDQVGLPSEISNYAQKVKGQKPLTNDGLPVMLYVGAEYCPFCAAERWAMIMALSKFGTFSNVGTTSSSTSDFAPDTPTFTFYKSTYRSNYLVFEPYELATNTPAPPGAQCNVDGYACLDTSISKTDYDIFESVGGGSFPFMDFGNSVAQSGAGFEDQPLALQGLDWDQVASQLYDANTVVAQAEDGSANYLTAAICVMTGNEPGSVCSAPYVSQAQKMFGS